MRRRRRAALAAIASTAILLSVAPAEAATVRSGSLSADLASDPWRARFLESGRGTILAEHPGRGSGPSGSLGFATATGWFHATRVVSGGPSGRAFAAVLDTNDPLGRQIRVRVDPSGEGVVRVEAKVEGPLLGAVTATGIGFGARPGERYLGFGERSNAVDQRGNEVENQVLDGPYQAEERPFVGTFVPSWGLGQRDDSTYFPMPWLLSTLGYGMLVENTERSRFRLASDDPAAWSLEAESSELAFRVFAGPRPADVLRRLTAFTGRQPAARAPWFLGPWYQPTTSELPQARALRAADVPASAANTYLHYLPCGDQEGVEAAQPGRTAGFHAAGYAVTTYFNPMVCATYSSAYDDAVADDVLAEDALGQPYLYRYGADVDQLFLVSQIDFSASRGNAFYGRLLGEATRHGYDGWMEDFGEYTPPDSRSANGMTGEQMHNLYPVLYHRAGHLFSRSQRRPVAGFVRSGWTGVHRYASLVWGGDPTTDWGFDGLGSAVRQGLTMGTSGISRWGSDVGGFFALGSHELTPELLIRWIEFGSVSGIMRTEANGVALPPKSRPQVTDPQILPTWRRYAKLRTQLYPYLQAAESEYGRTGLPVMRHLALVYPSDSRAIAQDDEFMFGPDLLAAPVIEPGARTRRIYVPSGRWVDLWRAVSYQPASGALRLSRRAATLRGGRFLTVPAPLGELPLLARAGMILPLLPADVDTLAPYGGRSVVNLGDRADRLGLLAFPRGKSVSRFGTAGQLLSNAKRRRWKLRIVGAKGKRIRLQASLSTLRKRLRPCRIRVNGRRLKRGKRWRFDRANRVLRARFASRRRVTRVVVSDRRVCRRSKGSGRR